MKYLLVFLLMVAGAIGMAVLFEKQKALPGGLQRSSRKIRPATAAELPAITATLPLTTLN